MRRPLSHPRWRPAAILWIALSVACAPASDVEPANDLDRSVARFVSGDYAAAIEGFERVVASTDDDAVKREAYAYIGRAHMARGETDEAITAFTMGVRHGDRGVCVEYLEALKPYVEGAPGSLHLNEAVTRGQLAGAMVRLFDSEAPNELTGPTPIARAVAHGWMPALADGKDHADETVSESALYVIAARLLAEGGASGKLDAVFPGGYRRASASQRPVSGTEAMAVLERVRAHRETDGRQGP